MLDLSVPWNTSSPAFKKLKGVPKVGGRTCAATNNGDLFMLSDGRGYIYNSTSKSWRSFKNTNFATIPFWAFAVSDPETGIVYLPNGGKDLSGKKRVMLTVDTGTNKVTSTAFNPLAKQGDVVAWSALLRSLVVINGTHDPALFTPSKVTKSSDGWSVLKTTGKTGKVDVWSCGAPAYGGSTMVFLGGYVSNKTATNSVYMLDVVKGTWKQGPSVPKGFKNEGDCAVSGDQFIAWGSMPPTDVNNNTSKTLVFNIKTEKWVSKYAPPRPQPRPTTTLYTLEPSQTPTQETATMPSDTFSHDKQLVIIIVAVIGSLMAGIVGLVFRHHRRRKQTSPNGSSISSLDINDDINVSRKEGPSEAGHAR